MGLLQSWVGFICSVLEEQLEDISLKRCFKDVATSGIITGFSPAGLYLLEKILISVREKRKPSEMEDFQWMKCSSLFFLGKSQRTTRTERKTCDQQSCEAAGGCSAGAARDHFLLKKSFSSCSL